MKKKLKTETFLNLLAAFFMLLFVYTAVSKFIGINRFTDVLSNSPLIGDYANIIAWSVPIIELGISLLLLFESTRKLGFILSTALMTGFTGYIIYMIAYSPKLPCSCGGVIEGFSWNQHLALNITLTIIALVAVILEYNHQLFIAINRRS